MIPLKKSVVKLNAVQKEIAESNIRSRIAKRHTMWSANTAIGVIFPERLFVGKENKNGTITVARYRNRIFKLFPKIYTEWYVEQHGEQVELKLKHRMSTFTILGLWMFSVQYLVTGIFGKWLTPTIFLTSVSILILGIYLLLRETRINEELLTKISKERLEK
jgi:hypothetical protein